MPPQNAAIEGVWLGLLESFWDSRIMHSVKCFRTIHNEGHYHEEWAWKKHLSITHGSDNNIASGGREEWVQNR